MHIKPLFPYASEITLQSYLEKCGVEDVKEFLKPTGKYIEDPFHYKNMKKAVELLHRHINDKIRILVDTDLDGFASFTVVYSYIKDVNPKADVEPIYHKKAKAHGLTKEVLLELKRNSCDLLICPDSSSNDFREQKELSELGIDILILDHHYSTKDSKHATIVNNYLSPKVVNMQGSGTLVTHRFCKAYDITYGYNYSPKYIDLVALGNIGDVMAINTGENRCYNHFGLKKIQNPFIKKLCENVLKDEPVTPDNAGWKVLPKINGAIRSSNFELKKNIIEAMVGIKDNYEEIIEQFDKLKSRQDRVVKDYFEDVMCDIEREDKVIIHIISDLEHSYTGLVAGKICDALGKPCILLRQGNDEWVGSVRSPVVLLDIFKKCECVNWAEGQPKAHGISVKDLNDFKQFCEELELPSEPEVEVISTIDGNYVKAIPNELFDMVEKFGALWGKGIPKPQFHVFNIAVNGQKIKVIGQGTTVKWTYRNVDYIILGISHEKQRQLHVGEDVDIELEVIGCLNINTWNNRKTKQVKVSGWEIVG